MEIREGRLEDASSISELTTYLTNKYISSGLPSAARRFLEDELSLDKVRSNMERGCRYYVCEIHGSLIGVCAMRPHGHLLKLFVAECAQRRGVASALWAAARDACIRAGHKGPFTVSAAPT